MQPEDEDFTLLPTGVENSKDLIHKTLNSLYTTLIDAVNSAPTKSKDNQSYEIMVSASERDRLLLDKLIAVLKWSPHINIIERCSELIMYDNEHLSALTTATTVLNAAVGRIQISLQPIFPIKSALAVLNDGEYPFIPPVCDSKTPYLSRLTKEEGMNLMTRILQTRILTEDAPPCCHSIKVSDCSIICEEKGLFTVTFTATKPEIDSPFTVTQLSIVNNNNTRLIIFPFFSSLQISRIIHSLNYLIQDDNCLYSVITMIYKVLYYIITKQILYVLHTQLTSLSPSEKETFGINPHSISYSINETSLKFSFWESHSRKRPRLEEKRTDYEEDILNPNRIFIYLEEKDGLMLIKGKCNHHIFDVSLRDYRIITIIHDCIHIRQSELLSEIKQRIENEIESSHADLFESKTNNQINQLTIRFGQTQVSLHIRVNPFTGVIERNLSEPSLEYWCRHILHDLYVAMDVNGSFYELIERLYVYCVLYHVNHIFSSTFSVYHFVYGYYEGLPCLYLPCTTFQNTIHDGRLEQYFILIRLLNKTSERRGSSYPSYSNLLNTKLRPSQASYHTINNKMNALNQYPDNIEIGYDIDDNEMSEENNESSESDEEEWVIDMTGLVRINGQFEIIETIKKVVSWDHFLTSQFTEDIKCCIEKCMPRLRFESSYRLLHDLSSKNAIVQLVGDRNTRMIRCSIPNINCQIALHIEDGMEIKVLQVLDRFKLIHHTPYQIKKRFYPHIDINDSQALIKLVPNASTTQFYDYMSCFNRTIVIYSALLPLTQLPSLSFSSTIELHIISFFTLVISYSFPDDLIKHLSSRHFITITSLPNEKYQISSNLCIREVNSQAERHIQLTLYQLNTNIANDVLLLIAAQYVYESIWEELNSTQGLLDGIVVVVSSLSVSRMRLSLNKKEAVSLHLTLSQQNILITIPDNIVMALQSPQVVNFLTTILGSDKSIKKEYSQIRSFVHDIIVQYKQM